MTTTTEIHGAQAHTGSGDVAHSGTRHRRWHFVRHYLEMIAAMVVGMVVVGGALRGLLALAGLALPTQYPELAALEMAFTMSVGMVAWMRYRRHGWASTLEMAGAMFVPAIALFPLLWADVISGDALVMAEHVAMLPLMLLIMLRRRSEYVG